MTDKYAQLVNQSLGRNVAKKLGLPQPAVLRRYEPGGPLISGPVLVQGGTVGADKLRASEDAVAFVRAFLYAGKPVAAICHAPWVLIETGQLHGRTLTSYPTVQTDIRNAGATWVDKEVVRDAGLITSRNPDDLPAFCKALIAELRGGE